QKALLEFFREPPDSPRWKQAGVYTARRFGPAGRRLQVILLDTRTHRSALYAKHTRKDAWGMPRAPYAPHPDPGAGVLGEAQWQWLARVLKEPAQIRIIASSIQLIPAEHGHEKWANFPRERDRFFRLIESTRAGGVILVSGDRHLAEISRFDDGPYPVLELTTSGLNAGGGGRDDEPNGHRIGRNYRGTNFGTIEVDWEQADPGIALRAHDERGKPVLEHRLTLSRLQPAKSDQLESR
ncbi:MAG: alkaline phosphatase D family protein, partial [Phycisphaerae bacterium]|nr:alkaline phosphatase D family protein [Phycisphaerae bacterium]